MTTDYTPDVLYGITLGFTALALELSKSGAISDAALLARMERFAKLMDIEGSEYGAKWLRETATMLQAYKRAEGG